MDAIQAIQQVVGFLHVWNPSSLKDVAAANPDFARAGLLAPGMILGEDDSKSLPQEDLTALAVVMEELLPRVEAEAKRALAVLGWRIKNAQRLSLTSEVGALFGSGSALSAFFTNQQWAIYVGASIGVGASIFGLI